MAIKTCSVCGRILGTIQPYKLSTVVYSVCSKCSSEEEKKAKVEPARVTKR